MMFGGNGAKRQALEWAHKSDEDRFKSSYENLRGVIIRQAVDIEDLRRQVLGIACDYVEEVRRHEDDRQAWVEERLRLQTRIDELEDALPGNIEQ